MRKVDESKLRPLMYKVVIPEKKIGDKILDHLSHLDDLFIEIAKILLNQQELLEQIKESITAIPQKVAPPSPPYIPAIWKTTREIKITEMGVLEKFAPVRKVSSVRYELSDTNDTYHELSDETDFFVVINDSDSAKIRVEFGSPTSSSSLPIRAAGGVEVALSKDIRGIYLRSVSGTAEVVIIEWKYV